MKNHLILLCGPGYFGEGVQFESEKVSEHEQLCQLMEGYFDDHPVERDHLTGALAATVGDAEEETSIIVRSTKGSWRGEGEGLRRHHGGTPSGRDLRGDGYFEAVLGRAWQAAIDQFARLSTVSDAEIDGLRLRARTSGDHGLMKLAAMALDGYARERLECVERIKGGDSLGGAR